MQKREKQPAEHFSDAYRRLLAETLGESGIGALRASYGMAQEEGEKLVQCIWFDQYLRADATQTEDGRRVEVRSPGWWNAEAGPDFRGAELQFDGNDAIRTDVEVHLNSSDWYRHGHDKDPAYSRVGLHVVLQNDAGDSFVACHDGTRVPQLVVTRFLTQELEDIAEAATPQEPRPQRATPGECAPWVEKAGADWVSAFLDEAGDERVLRKAENFEAQLSSRTLDDVLLEGIMDALGYKSNRRPFRRLARRLPAAELKRFVPPDADEAERTLRLEAILLGVAGLLPETESAWDAETTEYAADLLRDWQPLSRELGGRALRRAEWNFGGMRPLNRPERRIAGAARWLARCLHGGLFRGFLACIEAAQCEGTETRRAAEMLRHVHDLIGAGAGYWSRRCSLNGKRLSAASQLVGRERTSAMTANVIIPLMLCESRRSREPQLEEKVHSLYASLKPLSENFATRYVAARIFGSQERAEAVLTTARRQQGLLQLFADFCHFADMTCRQCVFKKTAQESEPRPQPPGESRL